MSEYVVKVHEKRKMTDFPNDPLTYLLGLPVLEEVVRCRDCKRFNTNETCALFDDAFVEPDGFCKWGERFD